MSYAISLIGGKTPKLRETTVMPDSSTKILTPGSDYDGFSKVTILPEQHPYYYDFKFGKASSNYKIVIPNILYLSDAEDIVFINLVLNVTSSNSPVTRAVHSLSMNFVEGTSPRVAEWMVCTKVSSTGYSLYKSSSDQTEWPVSMTSIESTAAGYDLELTLTEKAVVPGKTSRLVFDTSIMYDAYIVHK